MTSRRMTPADLLTLIDEYADAKAAQEHAYSNEPQWSYSERVAVTTALRERIKVALTVVGS